MPLDPVVPASALLANPDWILVDCRTGPQAKDAYKRGHLPGARFADLETDLAQIPANAATGGRHPLPTAAAFAACLGRWGITPGHHVVAYDDQDGANAAARFWWMLRAFGHERVQILDGGIDAAVAQGVSLSDDVPVTVAAPAYPTDRHHWPVVGADEVEALRQMKDARVLDVRAAARFGGEVEPIDPIAGHIPGAHNIPLTENLSQGRWKSSEELATIYRSFLGDIEPSRLVVHCGSGVTACHTLLALERAGIRGAKLYVGSWSEWCRAPGRPRAP